MRKNPIFFIFKLISKLFLFIYRAISLAFMLITLSGLILLISFITIKTKANDQVKIEPHSYLAINLDGQLLEQREASPFSSMRLGEHYAFNIATALEKAATDKAIEAIFINVEELSSLSIGALNTVINALKNFQAVASEKPIYVYGVTMSAGTYVLASYGTHIVLNPLGEVALKGVGSQNLYFKNALDRYGLTAYVSRAGEFKSAVEPFTSSEMSAGNKTILTNYLTDFWQMLLSSIADNPQHQLSVATLQNYATNRALLASQYRGNMAKLALDQKLVDEIATLNQLEATYLDDLTAISYRSYLKAGDHNTSKKSANSIAILYAHGTIVKNSSSTNFDVIESGSFVKQLKAIAAMPSTKAIIIRLNSGGGDVLASEEIYEAIAELKSTTPIYISMSDMAASGAYWLSLAANGIWAEPTTLTGSIGVFSYFVSAHQFLNDHGITADGVAIDSNEASGISFATAPSAETLALMQSQVDYIYQLFLNRVTENRTLTVGATNVKVIAEGRIFSAQAALAQGLIDNIGNLDAVVDAVASELELEEGTYDRLNYQQSLSPIMELAEMILFKTSLDSATTLATPLAQFYSNYYLQNLVKSFEKPQILSLEPITIELN